MARCNQAWLDSGSFGTLDQSPPGSDSVRIRAAGRYQYLDGFELESNGSSASLSFDSAFVLSLGALYSF
jgi:hypothetical protein